ncbi:uncharacterized protein LOC136087065 [Hydra vulgaris]|uniref:ATP-dependent DNA helicase n=1 Tax=Hydra vulgaris TaxID=6087 RepID=A0ABM4CUN5_HYDVU
MYILAALNEQPSVENQHSRMFFMDEPAGSGKTLPSLIPKHALNAIDRLLKDICNNNFPFGGKDILFGGDFRQILPVVKRGQPAEVVESCIKCSLQSQWVQKFALTQNMRVQDGEVELSQWLLKLRNGTTPIFGDTEQNDYSKRVILTPTNVDSLSINKEVLQCLSGEVKIYLSADQIETDDLNERNNFPVEFLNSLTPSGMPPYCLKLKIGCAIMLLRNLGLKAGLCNGTRMKVCALQNSYIDAEVLTGVSSGKRVFVPRIQLAPLDSNLPFVLKRRQFPVRLAYSMTINKSQGQTFDRVGVYLKRSCFSHGQLYVACSRTRAFNNFFFKIDKHLIQGMVDEKCYTNNFIFSNVLNL